jgi:nucleotide-binding universal stress UspA family protein
MKPRAPAVRSVLPRHILVGVEEEGRSDAALWAGFDLGRRLGIDVEFIHAVHIPLLKWFEADPTRETVVTDAILREASDSVNARVHSRIGLEVGAVSAPGTEAWQGATNAIVQSEKDLVRIVAGVPARVLVERARELEPAWIVLGDHKRRGGFDFGSTSRAVLAGAPGAVWIQKHPPRPIRTILAAIDLSELRLFALANACALAKVLGATVQAIDCLDPEFVNAPAILGYPNKGPRLPDEIREAEKESFERTMSGFDWQGVEHAVEFVDREPREGILERSRKSDLVVLGTHGQTGFVSGVLGGVAYAVLKRSEVPVLAVRPCGLERA